MEAEIITAVRRFGSEKQIDMAIEECAELIQALNKAKRAGVPRPGNAGNRAVCDHVREEIADVSIMLDQMRFIFGDDSEWRRQKIDRLSRRLNERD